MGLQPKTTELSIVDDNKWLLSQSHGKPQTGTLDLTKFEVDAEGGVIPDSTPVVFNDASKLYEPAIAWSAVPDPDAYVQAAVAAGHVYTPVAYDAGQTHAQFALLWDGRIKASEVAVPPGHGGVATFDKAKGAKGVTYV